MNERDGTEAEIAECAKIMLGAFRLADADDPDIYVGHIRRVLSQYPLWVVKRAASRVADELKWLPAPKEVREICDAIYAPVLREQQRRGIRDETLAHRVLPPPPRQSYEDFCREMTARGLPIHRQVQFDLVAFKTKFAITDEQFDQLPDRQNSTWKSPKTP